MDWTDDAPAIRKALITKHHEYGDVNAPFVIAVGTYIHDRDRWHTTNGMYGAAAVELSEGPAGRMATRGIRQPDGYFGVPPDWRHRNVSGVLMVNQLMPYHLQHAEITLWQHPNPVHALTTSSASLAARWLTMTASSRRSIRFHCGALLRSPGPVAAWRAVAGRTLSLGPPFSS